MSTWIDRPDFEEDGLVDWMGYVTRIRVDQEGENDQLKFSLETFTDSVAVEAVWRAYLGASEGTRLQMNFNIYMDTGTTVALAQLQLLRLAWENRWPVRIHCQPPDDWPYDTPCTPGIGYNHVYWVRVFEADYYPVTWEDVYYG